jgi:hypothetical protein
MFWIEDADAVDVMPAIKQAATNTTQFFQDGNPQTGKRATIVTADIMNTVMMEILNAVIAAGITPDKQRLDQLALAIEAKAQTIVTESLASSNVGNGTPTGSLQAILGSTLDPGWYACQGTLISNASQTIPALYARLQEGVWANMLTTQANWDNLRNAAPFSGVGGAPYYVLDIAGNSVRLPDLRGMHLEGWGGSLSGLSPGQPVGDMIRNFPGGCNGSNLISTVSGPFYWWEISHGSHAQSGGADIGMAFDPSRVVPTGPVNRPKSVGVVYAIYAGLPAES